MNVGKTLFAQVMEFVPWRTFSRIVERHIPYPLFLLLFTSSFFHRRSVHCSLLTLSLFSALVIQSTVSEKSPIEGCNPMKPINIAAFLLHANALVAELPVQIRHKTDAQFQ
jgi:hypothetical protein